MLFYGSTISSVVYLRCRMQIQAKPMNRKRFWSCLLSNGGRKLVQMRAEPSLLELCRVQPSFCKLLQTVYRLTFSYSNEVWLPLHPTKEEMIDGVVETKNSINNRALFDNHHSNCSQIFQRLIIFDREKFGKRQISLPPK